jgi:hypothetical protein
MTDKITSKKPSKPFRVERFMDSANEPDNLTPPEKQKKINTLSKNINNNILTINTLPEG